MFDGMSVTPLNTSTPLDSIEFMPVALSFVLTLQKDFCRQTILKKHTDCPQTGSFTRAEVAKTYKTVHHFPVKDPYK